MNLKEETEKLTVQRQALLTKIRLLDQQRVLLVQEALRLDGAIGLLDRMTKEEKPNVLDYAVPKKV